MAMATFADGKYAQLNLTLQAQWCQMIRLQGVQRHTGLTDHF